MTPGRVRLEGAHHLWRKVPSGELSVDPKAYERRGWATGIVVSRGFERPPRATEQSTGRNVERFSRDHVYGKSAVRSLRRKRSRSSPGPCGEASRKAGFGNAHARLDERGWKRGFATAGPRPQTFRTVPGRLRHLQRSGTFIHRCARCLPTELRRRQTTGDLAGTGCRTVKVINRSDNAKNLDLPPRRWVVERTFAWPGRCRARQRLGIQNTVRNSLARNCPHPNPVMMLGKR